MIAAVTRFFAACILETTSMKAPILLWTALLLPTLLFAAEPPRQQLNFNREWKFQLGDQPGAEAAGCDDSQWDDIGLPHSFSLPYFLSDKFYVGYGWYRKHFKVPAKWAGQRLFLEFEYNTELIALVRQIDGAAWSQTRKAWHIPDTKEACEQLLLLFPEAERVKLPAQPIENEVITEKAETAKTGKPLQAGVEIWVIGKHIQIKLPKNEADIQFLQTFRYVRWNRAEYHWEVPNYGNNLRLRAKDGLTLVSTIALPAMYQ